MTYHHAFDGRAMYHDRLVAGRPEADEPVPRRACDDDRSKGQWAMNPRYGRMADPSPQADMTRDDSPRRRMRASEHRMGPQITPNQEYHCSNQHHPWESLSHHRSTLSLIGRHIARIFSGCGGLVLAYIVCSVSCWQLPAKYLVLAIHLVKAAADPKVTVFPR